MDHPNDATIEHYVIGALEGAAHDDFVAHVSACEACAAKLAREAETELAVLEVSEARRARARTAKSTAAPAATIDLDAQRRRRRLLTAATVIALAAAVLLFLRSKKEDDARDRAPMSMKASAPRTAAPIPLVTCPDGIGQEKCIEDAHRHGLSVGYPPWAGAPPLGGGPSDRGPNGSPFAPPAM